MKKLALIFGLLLCALPSHAAISKIGGCAAATTSCTMPGNNIGDFIYVNAFRSATTAPTLPAGFTTIATASASNSSFRSGCKVATTTTEVSGTWTNATSITVEIYRGEKAKTTAECATTGRGIGGNANSSGTTSTITYATVTMSVADGTSWVIGASGSSVATCTPSGMSAAQSQTTVNILNDTNAGVSSWSSTNCTGSAGNWKSNVVEILADPCYQTVYGVFTCQQSPVGCTHNGTNCVITFLTAPSVASNDTIFIFVYTSAGATPTVTDSASQVYTLDQSQVSTEGVFLFSKEGSASGITTVTCTTSNFSMCRSVVVKGIAITNAAAVDQKTSQTVLASTTFSSGNTSSTVDNNEWLMGGAGTGQSGTPAYAVTSSGWIDGGMTNHPTDGDGSVIGYRNTTTTGVQVFSGTDVSLVRDHALIVTYRAPAAAGGCSGSRLLLTGAGC